MNTFRRPQEFEPTVTVAIRPSGTKAIVKPMKKTVASSLPMESINELALRVDGLHYQK